MLDRVPVPADFLIEKELLELGQASQDHQYIVEEIAVVLFPCLDFTDDAAVRPQGLVLRDNADARPQGCMHQRLCFQCGQECDPFEQFCGPCEHEIYGGY